MEDWVRDSYPDIPLVSCNPEDLEITIKNLLDNPDRMKEIAQKSVEWYTRNATLEKVGERMVEVFSGKTEL